MDLSRALITRTATEKKKEEEQLHTHTSLLSSFPNDCPGAATFPPSKVVQRKVDDWPSRVLGYESSSQNVKCEKLK